MYDLILNHNASYPVGTYDEVAFPFFSLDRSDPTVQAILLSNNVTAIDIEIPVIRPSLNCSVVPRDQLIMLEQTMPLTKNVPGNGTRTFISAILDLPLECQHSVGAYANTTQINATALDNLVVPANRS